MRESCPAVQFAQPVTPAYARVVREFAYEMTGAGVRALPTPPPMHFNLSRVSGADVFLMFLESYGAVSWDRPEFAEALAASRAHLEADIRETGRSVSSALVESTTFGGESWLAHVSLLSGTEVRDQRTNVRLMAQQRDTLVKVFGRQGYRTVAIMPGLLRGWPAGSFYGFEAIYDLGTARLPGTAVRMVGHQRSVCARARGCTRDCAASAAARLHFLSDDYDARALHTRTALSARLVACPDVTRVRRGRSRSRLVGSARLAQPRAELRPCTRLRVHDRWRLPPPAGRSRLRHDSHWRSSATWTRQWRRRIVDVPVHVITSRRGILDRLRNHGFRDGLTPGRSAVARMDTLLPLLLDAFGDEEVSTAAGRR
jgi:hypothetical protein